MLRRASRAIHTVFELEDFAKVRSRAESQGASLVTRSPVYSKPLPSDFAFTAIPHEFSPPPTLKHGLDRLVRTDGIYTIDTISKAIGSDFLRTIAAPSPEVLARFPEYTPPSRDKNLLSAAKANNVRYVTGSSSITDELMHIYFLLSNFKTPDLTGLGKNYDSRWMMYMSAYRKPTTFMLRKLASGLYAVDGDSGLVPAMNQDLSEMGVVLEALLTTDEATYRRIIDPKTTMPKEEMEAILSGGHSHKMRKVGNMVVRSQIDCESTATNGEKFVFEIKTRATAPIRYDVKNLNLYLDYQIKHRSGVVESFEREYFDLIRSILIKYYFQVKMGHMDGAFLCYHNTRDIFGFQYISLEEIEKRVFGCKEFAETVFKTTLQIHQMIMDEALKLFPDREMLRIGLFSDFRKEELIITIEEFDEKFDWGEPETATEGIEDEHDYYMIHHPGKRVFSLRMHLFSFLNGIYQREPLFFEPGDRLEVRYDLEMRGVMSFEEYMYFLHAAYKFDTAIYCKDFTGVWKRLNDFHVYRRPLHLPRSGL